MRQDRDESIFHRANDALGHLRFGQIKNRMNGRDHEIQFGQNLIVKIEFAIAKNIALHSCKNPETVRFLVQFPNRRDLRAQLRRIDAVRLNRALAVLGNSQIFQAELLRRCRHFLECIVTVACDGVTMKRAAQIFLLD